MRKTIDFVINEKTYEVVPTYLNGKSVEAYMDLASGVILDRVQGVALKSSEIVNCVSRLLKISPAEVENHIEAFGTTELMISIGSIAAAHLTGYKNLERLDNQAPPEESTDKKKSDSQ